MEVLRIFWEANWMTRSGPVTLIQQITVALYLLTAVLCFGLGWSVRKRKLFFRYDVGFWVGLGTVCMALAINRAFNVQGALTSTLRMVAYQGFWYNTRRSIQEPAIIGMIVAGLTLFLLLRWVARPVWQKYKLATLGIGALITLVAIRAVSLHFADYLLYSSVLGLHLHQLIEFSAIALVVVAAFRRFRMLTPQHHPA